MILEMGVTWATVSAGLYYALYREKTDQEKIKLTFEHVKYGFGKKQPILVYKRKKDKFIEYIYSLPEGLLANPKLEYILEETLNKPVRIDLDSQLSVRVYKEKLKKKIAYEGFEEGEPWSFPLGYNMDGKVWHDFSKIPHMTIAGMTRQGKTVLLKNILYHLIKQHPEDIRVYILDLKGGLEFNRYRNLKQVVNVASNVDEAKEALEDVLQDIQEQMVEFITKGIQNVNDSDIKQRTFVIIDEGAELAPPPWATTGEKKKYQFCQGALSEISRVAGGLGFYQIFCTQYPTSDTLPRTVKQNSDAKISFRLPTDTASKVALDEEGAQYIEDIGRCIYRTADKEIVQVPLIKDKDIWEDLKKYEEQRETVVKRRSNLDEFSEDEVCDSGAVEKNQSLEKLQERLPGNPANGEG